MTKHLRGNDLLRAVVEQITNHPETWNQDYWHCGTTHCVAGWAQILGGAIQSDSGCRSDAEYLLDFNMFEADYLFSCDRTLDEIKEFARERLEK